MLPEILVAGEGLWRPAEDVLGTLLHEAGHSLAHVRQIKDTSRGRRYHNARYRDVAAELGLEVSQARAAAGRRPRFGVSVGTDR